MRTADIRNNFLEFFKERGHTIVPSMSLIPENDPTILFTTAGMAQFKDLFLGVGNKPYARATSVQRCLRAPDLENVGKTPRHHTFFEMLGNFSFGDYFKEQAIPWTWEMFTQALGFDPNSLWISVFRDDDEAAAIWKDIVGIPESRIKRFDEDENFWPGHPKDIDNGPCGPCSELYFDPHPELTDENNPDYEKFVEIGNIVFMQYNRMDGGKLQPLPNPNIDFGGGLERIAAASQGKATNFETDLFMPLIEAIASTFQTKYVVDSEDGVRIRRIADHVRAVTFCIHDRALPSNEGRGYVVRKIIRRAVSDARALGMDKPTLFELTPVVAEIMPHYPDLKDDLKNISMFLENEEKQFLKTLDQGMKVLDEYMLDMKEKGITTLDGERAFKLYDTFGLPSETSGQHLSKNDFSLDMKGFNNAMQDQRKRAQAGSKMKGEVFEDNYLTAVKNSMQPTIFTGYAKCNDNATIQAVAVNEALVDSATSGQDVVIVSDSTPFYAESGGQVGDRGVIQQGDAIVDVSDTQNNGGYILHFGKVRSGTIHSNKTAEFQVDEALRDATCKNHTSAHLLHGHLKAVLGDHVSQAGSLVDENRCRFDFTHPKQVSKKELREIESLVNADIQRGVAVDYYETDLDKARADGVVAMFGEKYGDVVRVVNVPGISKELCGGTHIDNIGRIGVFKFVSETALAAGVRRVEAVTGHRAMETLFQADAIVSELRSKLAVKQDELLPRIDKIMSDSKGLQRQLNQVQKAQLAGQLNDIIANSETVNGVKVISHHFKGAGGKELQGALEVIGKLKDPYAACLFGSEGKNKVSLVVRLHADVVAKGLKAGTIIKDLAAIVGGKGGGRPDQAQAGGSDVSKISDAMKAWSDALSS